MPDPIVGYKNPDPTDPPQGAPPFIHPNNGVLVNVIRSVSRRIAQFFDDQQVFFGGNIFKGTNIYVEKIRNDSDAGDGIPGSLDGTVSAILSIPFAQRMQDNGVYRMRVVVQVEVILPKAGYGRFDLHESSSIGEMDNRSFIPHLMLADALFIALASVPYYDDDTETGYLLRSYDMEQQMTDSTTVTVTYEFPIRMYESPVGTIEDIKLAAKFVEK